MQAASPNALAVVCWRRASASSIGGVNVRIGVGGLRRWSTTALADASEVVVLMDGRADAQALLPRLARPPAPAASRRIRCMTE
jgi:hypothetical protein